MSNEHIEQQNGEGMPICFASAIAFTTNQLGSSKEDKDDQLKYTDMVGAMFSSLDGLRDEDYKDFDR